MQRMTAAQYRQEVVEPALEEEREDGELVKKLTGNFKQSFKDAKNHKDRIAAVYAPLEKDIQTAILNRLGLLQGAFFWRENSGLVKVENNGKQRTWRAGIKGISDIMGVYKGRMVAIEVKRPGKKASQAQHAFMNRVRECGGIAFICDDDSRVVELLEKELG